MDRLASAVILSWGWRRRAIAVAAGALSSLAQPPFFLFPILWLTFPVLVWLVDGAASAGWGRRRLVPAFATGWWFGFGYFAAGLWWIGEAFLVEADTFAWLMPLAVIVFPAALAILWGLGVAAARLLWSDGPGRIFALAAGLGGAEWVRGHLFTGFPWNALGYALTAGEALMQSASVFGVEALSVLAVAIFAAPAVLADVRPPVGKRRWLTPGLAVAAVAIMGLAGLIRLGHADRLDDAGGETAIRIVQPALSQLQKWDDADAPAVLNTYLDLSRRGAPLKSGDVLVWPESAFPYELRDDPQTLAAIADLLPAGATLVTGAYRSLDLSGEVAGAQPELFNSIYVVGDDGTILSGYDKVHLVPFGEYLPAAAVLGRLGLRQLVPSGFSAGARRPTLTLPLGPPFAPIICYEAIFSGAVLGEGPRPGFILNVTNDGWFGRSIGPYQHFHQARLRAVEEGLPLVRAANTGISAVVDGYGRIVTASALGNSTTLDAVLPAGLPPTLFARNRHWPLILALVAAFIFATISFFTRLRNSD